MKRMIIIGRELSFSEIKQVHNQPETELICLGEYNLPFTNRVVTLTAGEKREINYSVLDEIIKLGDKLINGRSVVSHLQVEKSSIWHYHKFRTYFFVRNLNYELAKLSKIDISEGNVIYYCPNDFRFLKDEFPGIKLVFPSSKKQSINLRLSLKYLFFLKLRILGSLFTRFNSSGILIYYPERYNPVLDIHTLKPKEGNFLLDYLFGQAKSKLNLIGEVPVPKLKSKGSFGFHRGYFKSNESGHPKKNMESILARFAFGAYGQAKTEGEKLELKYAELISQSLAINERVAVCFVQSLHSSSVFYLFRYFAAKKFFSKNKFRVLLATDENSPLTKSIIDAAKFHGLKTVGMQHGTMHDLHPAYLYTEEDVRQGIIPDFTLTWGTYWEQFLVEKGNYPADKVISVGHLRTDIIPDLLNEQRCENEKFILVFASQPQRDPNLRRQAAFDVFLAAKQFSDLDLVVKLHPREFDDVEYYRQIANEAGCENYRIDTTTDLYQLIASCDSLITCFSTVGTETVYFNKPLIILDHLLQDIQGYYKEGVAFRATNADELREIISGLKSGDISIDANACQLFIGKYSYRIDGKVAGRVDEFLNRISQAD